MKVFRSLCPFHVFPLFLWFLLTISHFRSCPNAPTSLVSRQPTGPLEDEGSEGGSPAEVAGEDTVPWEDRGSEDEDTIHLTKSPKGIPFHTTLSCHAITTYPHFSPIQKRCDIYKKREKNILSKKKDEIKKMGQKNENLEKKHKRDQ